jgi:hypothetical protein
MKNLKADRYNRIYVGPTTAEAFECLTKLSENAQGKLIWVGTEAIYLHPAIKRLEVDFGGGSPFVIDLRNV